jgi:hypothetical protein
MPSRAGGRIAAVEPPERTRSHHAHKQNAHTHGDDVIRSAHFEGCAIAIRSPQVDACKIDRLLAAKRVMVYAS